MADGEPKRWVAKSLARHIARMKLPDAPEPDSEEFEDVARIWDEQFAKRKTNYKQVDEASRAVCAKGVSYWREQLPSLLAAIDEIQGANIAQGDAANGETPREKAELDSRDCRLCGGTGFAVVYHRHFTGPPIIDVVNSDGSRSRVAARSSAFCLCSYGRWLLDANRRSSYSPKIDAREGEKIRRRLARADCVQAVLDGLHPDYTLEDPRSIRYVDSRGVETTLDP